MHDSQNHACQLLTGGLGLWIHMFYVLVTNVTMGRSLGDYSYQLRVENLKLDIGKELKERISALTL